MNEITERFLQLVDKLIELERVKDYKDFALSVGISVSSMTEISKGRSNVGLMLIQKTVMLFADVSTEWLVKGEGEIFHTKSTEKFTFSEGEKDGETKGEKRKVQKSSPIDEVKVITLDTSGMEVIPIVDISAAAGAGTYNPDYVETLDTIKLPSRLLNKGVHNCIRISGDSMAPTMQDGGYVISRLLDRSEWEYIKTGYIYVVTRRDGETCIKRVRNRLREKGFIVCTSDNPDKEQFKNYNIDESEINTVWEVEWYLSARIPNIHDTYYSRMQTLIDDVDDLKVAMEKLLQKPGIKPV